MNFFWTTLKSIKPTTIYLTQYLKIEKKKFKYSTEKKIFPEDCNFENKLPKSKRDLGGMQVKYITIILNQYSILLENVIKYFIQQNKPKKVIAIGALGGSGTRAVAQVFLKLGLYMGDDLNNPNDNLLFTRLFKNPEWYQQSSIEEKELRLKIFEKYMLGNSLKKNEMEELFNAVRTNITFKTEMPAYKLKFEFLYLNRKKREIWGWKEPNTQIFLSEILNYFPELKYIHVLRHGLDMAFSNNIQQLKNWGWKYDINLTGNETKSQIAFKQLNYWIESTKNILSIKETFKDRVLILNHSDFYLQPKIEIDKMMNFCDLTTKIQELNELYKIPKNSDSNNRYKKYNLDIFSNEQLNFVKKCGFKIDSTVYNV